MKPSSEERILAVIAHLSALAMGAGMVVPAVLWSNQRGKSKYASFQTLQAYGYQSLGYTVWMLLCLLFFVLIFGALFVIGLVAPKAAQNESISQGFAILIIVVSLGTFGLYLLFPLIAALMCALGKDYHYPILGGRLAKFLQVDETLNADRWVAAMGHFAVIIPLWGLPGPLYLWLAGRKNPAILKSSLPRPRFIRFWLTSCILSLR